MECSLTGCTKPAHGRGLCGMHYERWRKHGDPLGGKCLDAPRIEHWRAKVIVLPDGCWRWTGTTDPYGYGGFWNGERVVRAYRFGFEHFRGPIPAGMELDHLCRNPSCVNPEHLEPVTHRENMSRSRKTHCKYGHPYDEKNTRVNRDGTRTCRRCNLAAVAAYKARKRQAV